MKREFKVRRCLHCDDLLIRPYIWTDKFCSGVCQNYFAFLNPKKVGRPSVYTARTADREEPLGKKLETRINRTIR